MRKLALLLFVLFALSIGFGKELAGHSITVVLDRDGGAQITEKYTLQLNASDYEDFGSIAKSTSTDLSMWQAFFPDIDTSAEGNVSSLTTAASTAGAGNFGNNVILTYSIDNFANMTGKTGRDISYEVYGSEFSFYQTDIGKFVLPWKTDLQIKFAPPIKKTDIVDVAPSPSQSAMVDDKYTLFWYGSRVDSTFYVTYQVEESVSEFDLSSAIDSLYLFFYGNPAYALAAAIGVVIIIVYRRPIAGLVTESFGSEEEIEMPKRGV
jgi:hypothetical protein